MRPRVSRRQIADRITASVAGRFSIRGCLGVGGMGIVYRAYDASRRTDVALKTLHTLDGNTLFCFKREFRSLTGIVHENLVTLYELLSADELWFFTMELIEGSDVLRHLRPDPAGEESGPRLEDLSSGSNSNRDLPTEPTSPVAGATIATSRQEQRREMWARRPVQLDRFHSTIRQLATGIAEIHRAGKLHQDLKPSNVLVEATGRVVVCDFGLTDDASSSSREGRRPRQIAGTPAYMSPEQAAGGVLTEASDWYSLGVILFEALTGRLPFTGPPRTVLANKQQQDAPEPRTWTPEVPAFWNDLTSSLLQRDPARRPTGDALIGLVDQQRTHSPSIHKRAPLRSLFVGRTTQLQQLRDALEVTCTGRAAAVFLGGLSGMGKTALADRFLADVEAKGDALVLRGRCYKRESVPFKALDSLVDALSEHLLERSPEQRRDLLPDDFPALARVFPVMERVSHLPKPTNDGDAPRVSQELREKAFAALGALIHAIARERPTILFIDDLQWGDMDSAPFVADLLHHPHRPAVLFLATYRTEHEEDSAFLTALAQARLQAGTTEQVQRIVVGPLPASHSQELISHLLSDAPTIPTERIEAIVADAKGNPFFVAELARDLRDDGSSAQAGSLDDMLSRRVSALSTDAHALLSAVAMVARPVSADLLSRATAVKDPAVVLALLQSQRLVKCYDTSTASDIVETYHDRIRETVTLGLSEQDVRRLHRRLARAFEASDKNDLQALVEHWLGAGEHARAGEYSLAAARQAANTMAFERAAYHYELALELLDPDDTTRRELQTRLGDMLGFSGNLSASAQAYLAAADGAATGVALELRRRATEQLLRAGRLTEGLELVNELLASVGMAMPSSDRRAMLSIVGSRLQMLIHGRRFRASPDKHIPNEKLWRMDVCFSAASSMNIANPLIGSALAQKFVVHALRSGDPFRCTLALAAEAGFRATPGPSKRKVVHALMKETESVGALTSEPYAASGKMMAFSAAHFLLADWRNCIETATNGQNYIAENCPDGSYFRDQCTIWRLAALLYAGEFRTVCDEVPVLLRKAAEQGNEYLVSALRSWRTNLVWLIGDNADRAQRELELVTANAPDTTGFHVYHYYWLLARAQTALYQEDAPTAWQQVVESWKRLTRSVGMRVHTVRVEARFLRARCALACACSDSSQAGALLGEAEAQAVAIDKERSSWSTAIAQLIRANIAVARDQPKEAVEYLQQAREGFDRADMAAFAAIARVCLTQLELPPSERMPEAGDYTLKSQGVVRIDRFVALYAPAFRG